MESLVLDAAVDLVDAEGLGTGLEGITYARVFRRLEATSGARITRASVHERLWPDQAAFQAAVRRRLVEEAGADEGPEIIDLTGADSDGDRRSGSDDSTSRRTQTTATIRALLAFAPDDERSEAADSVAAFESSLSRRLDVLTAGYTRLIDERQGVVDTSHGLDFEQAVAVVVRAVAATADGAALHAPFDPDADTMVRSLPAGAEPKTLAGFVGWSLLEQLFDFSPESLESV